VQSVLANISAAIYAYKFTHFYDGPAPAYTSQNILAKTWKLFVGPSFHKSMKEPEPTFPYQNITLHTSDNIPIDGWYSNTDSVKSCVIFLHGLSANKSMLLGEAEKFREWGYNILMIDLRAHGKSGGNTTTFGVEETDEAQKAFDFAKTKGNQKIIVYGVSMGAVITLKAIKEHLINPTAIIVDAPFANMHDHFKSRARVLGFPAEPFGSLVTMWVGVERGYNGFKHDASAYAKAVNCPVLLEWGEKDRYVSRNEIESIYKSLGTSNKRLAIYPNTDHESYEQVQPLLWEKQVKYFLALSNTPCPPKGGT
jgi:alpha-beta hydrolase superfamily lysophospholipase